MSEKEAVLTPECEKMRAVKEKSQAIGEFLEWLSAEKGVHLAEYHRHTRGCLDHEAHLVCGLLEDHSVRWNYSIERLLAEYFDINLDKVETEKQALLDHQRMLNDALR
jgi:ribosomal protein S12 methylthiotransferase accessory factor YcaO